MTVYKQKLFIRSQVRGTPKPQVAWFQGKDYIFPTEDFLIESQRDGTQTLTIRESFPEDTGLYTCRATNRLGTTITQAQLTVLGKTTH